MRRGHLTTRQAAAHCRVSIPTLRRWIRAGALGAYLTPGGHRRIDLAEFQRFLRVQGRPDYPVGPAPRIRLLIVDDEPLVKVGTFRPSVIILDVVMPGLDGVEACRCLRRIPETSDIRILGVTGHPAMIPVLLSAGADACVTKPLDPDAVCQELRRLASATGVPHSL